MRTADPQAAVRDGIAAAARMDGGSLAQAGRWRWRLTGPSGTLVIKAGSTWPHRAKRRKIRERTGIVLPGQPPADDKGT